MPDLACETQEDYQQCLWALKRKELVEKHNERLKQEREKLQAYSLQEIKQKLREYGKKPHLTTVAGFLIMIMVVILIVIYAPKARESSARTGRYNVAPGKEANRRRGPGVQSVPPPRALKGHDN